MDQPRKGHARFVPYYTIDRKTGKAVPVYDLSDAIAYAARMGVKAGNMLLDEAESQIRQENAAERQKRLYRLDKK